MAGLRPGHPRLCSIAKAGVDARDKRGHDALRAAIVDIIRELPPRLHRQRNRCRA
jgi:hypothetical protein